MATSEIKMTMSLATAAVTTALGKLKTGIANFSTAAMDKLNQLVKVVSVGLVAGFVASARAALEYGKEMQNLADISNMGFEAFQKMAAAAKTVGIEQDKLADIYKDFNDKVGDFLETGGGPMIDFFENIAPKLGVTKEMFQGLSGDEGIALYIRSLEQAGLNQQQFTFYLEAMGSDLTSLQPIYVNNAELARKIGEEAEEAGRIMALSTAQRLESATNAIEQFKQLATVRVGELIAGEGDGAAIKQLGAQLMAMAAEFGGWIVNSFLTAGLEINVFFKSVAAKLKDELGDAFQFVGLKFMEAIAPTINHIREGLNALGMDIPLIGIDELQEKMNTLLDKPSKDLTEYMSEFREQIGPVNVSVDEQVGYWEKIAKEQGGILTKEQLIAKAAEEAALASKNKVGSQSMVSAEMENQLALAEALASGDQDSIRLANEQIQREEQINKLIKEAGVSRERATELVDQQNAQLDEQALLQRDLLDAQLDRDDIAIRAAEQKIALEDKALEIMKNVNTSYSEAIILAGQWLTMMAGADLNNSGFTTFFEQREFDRMEAERQQVLDDAAEAEEREQREQGGNIRNVSEERGDTGSVWERAAAAREQRLRDAENDRLNRIRDPEERAKELLQIEEDRRKRAEDQAIEAAKTEDEKKRLQKLADERRARDEKGIKQLENGDFIDKDGNIVDKDGNIQPKAPDPKNLDDVITKMDDMHKTIKSIDKSLKCEP